MGEDEPVALILSGWSDGPLPALEHSLRQRGLRCVRVPLPMPPCGVYWCANPFLLLLAGVVWLAIYAWNECTLEPFVVASVAGVAGLARADALQNHVRGQRHRACVARNAFDDGAITGMPCNESAAKVFRDFSTLPLSDAPREPPDVALAEVIL